MFDLAMDIIRAAVSQPVQLSTTAATVRLGETNLQQVAQRLKVNLDDLVWANPQIPDPARVSAGQAIYLPVTQSQPSTGNAAADDKNVRSCSGLQSPPIGDPLAASVMKAKLNAQIASPQNPENNDDDNMDRGTPITIHNDCDDLNAQGPHDAGICVPTAARTADDRTQVFVSEKQLHNDYRFGASLLAFPLTLNPLTMAWEAGVNIGEAISGESSGLHIADFIVSDDNAGQEMSTGDRILHGVTGGIQIAGLGFSALAASAEAGAVGLAGTAETKAEGAGLKIAQQAGHTADESGAISKGTGMESEISEEQGVVNSHTAESPATPEPAVELDENGLPKQVFNGGSNKPIGPAYKTFEEAQEAGMASRSPADIAKGKVPHITENTLYDQNGNKVASWWETSERLSDQGVKGVGRLGDTEQKALLRVRLEPGMKLEIRGAYLPCTVQGGCDFALQVVAERTGSEITYRTTSGAVAEYPKDDF